MDSLAEIVGAPVAFDELKHKPGRRRTLRARGSRMNAIVKLYASDRAVVVAQRVAALASGPPEPAVPSLLYVDAELRLVVLSDVPGRPLREALLGGDLASCRRAGAALGMWHAAWDGVVPDGLAPHTAEREIEILRLRMSGASSAVAAAMVEIVPRLSAGWECTTVVHRDLYEEQVLIGERVGLIDVDDTALGPPELDVGNLVAHLELLERRRGVDLVRQTRAILDGYAGAGRVLDSALLDRCRALSLLRLACINDDLELVRLALADVVPA